MGEDRPEEAASAVPTEGFASSNLELIMVMRSSATAMQAAAASSRASIDESRELLDAPVYQPWTVVHQ